MNTIVIGSRGSKLALIQSEIVKKQLQNILPKIPISITIITTKGDTNLNPVPLDSVGKGWFTKEIDKALLDGKIDIAVHSLKDVPEILPKGLVIAAVPKREDAREALISNDNLPLEALPKGVVIGTDSTRRKTQILFKRPDLVVESIRGNVPTRLAKLDSGQYDAIFLAVAGLKRLGLAKRITQYFDTDDIVPSPGQGALAVVIKKTNKQLLTLLEKLNDGPIVTAVTAERVFSKTIGGGCKMPVGMYAACRGDMITMYGVIGSLDGRHLAKDSLKGPKEKATVLAEQLAHSLLAESKLWNQIHE